MNAWSHLPNAHHIDRVLESVKSHPEIWDAAWSAARDAAWNAAWSAAFDAVQDAALYAARSAIAALIAYDDSSKYLDMPGDRLRIWAILSEDPAAVLLLPAVIAFEKIAKKEKQELTQCLNSV